MAHPAAAMSGEPNSTTNNFHTTAIESPPAMRHRLGGRGPTFDEAPNGVSHFNRRRSSMFSIHSFDETRRSLRSSTDDLLLPNVSRPEEDLHEGPSQWHSMPLLLAVIPAIGGLLFKNGRATLTDLLFLGLSAIFLNWSLRLPWEWYYAAQAVKVRTPSPTDPLRESTIVEESSEDEVDEPKVKSDEKHPTALQHDGADVGTAPAKAHDAAVREAAANELRNYELLALLSCFICPILGAYLLHIVRTSLSRRSEELVSDFNITIFLMAAEARPLAHVLKMIQARTLYLQRVAQPKQIATSSGSDKKVEELSKRMEELEAHLADATAKEDGKAPDSSKIVKDVRSSLQTELDALNRAVRRYEKRFTTHSFQTQARFEYVEKRLNDTLSLAAAAAQSQQKPGIIAIALSGASTVFMAPLQAAYMTVVYPLQVVTSTITNVQTWLFGTTLARKTLSSGKRSGQATSDSERLQARRIKR